jgi:hypothetical protein
MAPLKRKFQPKVMLPLGLYITNTNMSSKPEQLEIHIVTFLWKRGVLQITFECLSIQNKYSVLHAFLKPKTSTVQRSVLFWPTRPSDGPRPPSGDTDLLSTEELTN